MLSATSLLPRLRRLAGLSSLRTRSKISTTFTLSWRTTPEAVRTRVLRIQRMPTDLAVCRLALPSHRARHLSGGDGALLHGRDGARGSGDASGSWGHPPRRESRDSSGSTGDIHTLIRPQIKPDNWLIDAQGHLAISDFGLATDFHWSHDGAFFEQQRRELLYKHGIDLEDAGRRGDFASSRVSLDPPRPTNEEENPRSVFTWRDMQRRRMAFSLVGTNNYMAIEV